MFIYSEKVQRQAQDFKAVLVDAQHEAEITQEAMGREMAVKQPTVAQWMNPTSDHHMPAFELANLPKEILKPLMCWLLKGKMLDVMPVCIVTQLNGAIDDELLKMTTQIGEMAKRKELTPENLKVLHRRVDDMKTLLQQLEAEIHKASDQ